MYEHNFCDRHNGQYGEWFCTFRYDLFLFVALKHKISMSEHKENHLFACVTLSSNVYGVKQEWIHNNCLRNAKYDYWNWCTALQKILLARHEWKYEWRLIGPIFVTG